MDNGKDQSSSLKQVEQKVLYHRHSSGSCMWYSLYLAVLQGQSTHMPLEEDVHMLIPQEQLLN